MDKILLFSANFLYSTNISMTAIEYTTMACKWPAKASLPASNFARSVNSYLPLIPQRDQVTRTRFQFLTTFVNASCIKFDL